MDFSIVLLRPEIPHNTGAIGRLCVGLGVNLNLANAVSIAAYECQRQLSQKA